MAVGSDVSRAAEAAAAQAKEGLGGDSARLGVFFVCSSESDRLDSLGEKIRRLSGVEVLIGCTTQGVIGGEREIEEEPGVALWLASLPEVEIRPFHLRYGQTPDGGALTGWPEAMLSSAYTEWSWIVLGDPFSFPADHFLALVNEEYPGSAVVGGMASGAFEPRGNRLYLGDGAHPEGAVGILLLGNLKMRTVVSQGCRPIGQPWVVTRSQQNVVLELGGKPALQQARELFGTLPAEDQRLAQRGLHLGVVIDERKEHFDRGDFLIKNVVGADQQSGALMVTDLIRRGQTVQFHVRDHQTAHDDLQALLHRYRDLGRPQGALLFSCNGRGRHLFETPDHDISTVRLAFPGLPTAGFFAQGELGPVGGRNFIHGFTASLAFFEERGASSR
jgi:small ligand-binding sensory domain FIST